MRWLSACLLCCVAACSFDDTRQHCAVDEDCDVLRERCFETFCIKKDPADDDRDDSLTGANRDASSSSGNDDGTSSGEGSSAADGGEPGQAPPGGSGNGADPGSSGGSPGSTPSGSSAGSDGTAGTGAAAGSSAPGEAGSSAAGGAGDGAAGAAGRPPSGGAGASGDGASGAGPAAGSGGQSEPPPSGDCDNGETRPCYEGPSGTQGVGRCAAGTQRCADGRFEACTGAVVPRAESCGNQAADDDCDGERDNVPGLGGACTLGMGCGMGVLACQQGRDMPACEGPQSMAETCNDLDDDCDTRIDENVDKQTDINNCGGCGRTCTGGQSCCGGRCTDVQNDPANCGGCGVACTAGGSPTCCSGNCTDLLSDGNCGACGRACGLLGGVACTCERTDEGLQCVAPLLGLCL